MIFATYPERVTGDRTDDTYLGAALLFWFGPPIRDFIERRLSLMTTLFVVLLVGGLVAIRYVF